MSIDLSKDNLADYFPGDGKYGQISMDGHLLQLAQWPNRGYHHIGEIIDAGPTIRWLRPGEEPAGYSKTRPTGGKFIFREEISPTVQAEFERTGDMRVQGYLHNDWYFQDEPVGKIDGRVVQLLRYTRYGIADAIKSKYRRAVYQRFQKDRSRRYDPEVVNARYPKPSYLDTGQVPNSMQRLR